MSNIICQIAYAFPRNRKSCQFVQITVFSIYTERNIILKTEAGILDLYYLYTT